MTPALYTSIAKLRTFIERHHPVLYVTVAGLLLALAVFSLYEVLLLTDDPSTTPNTLGNFDQKTIQKIKALHDSGTGSSKVTLPSPRPNPFVE